MSPVEPNTPPDKPETGTLPAPDHPPEFGNPSTQGQAPNSGTLPAPSGPPQQFSNNPTGVPGERFPPGTLLANRYRIVSALGKGGMGEVYRADDLTLGQPVALKFLPAYFSSDHNKLDALRKEVATARRVSHPNVCRVYDITTHDGQSFLTMEFVDGEDLASLLKRVGRLSEEKAIEVTRQLCESLAAVHDQGLLHRDLKPANVMLDGRGRVRLTDFGLAAAEESVSGAEVRYGTPSYQAPEQAAGKEVTVRSDVYALGLIIYELITGKRAYPDANRTELPTPASTQVAGLNPAIERVIDRCLAFDPAKRPQSAAAVLAALPGGDPLAEALAAGITPSPEVVAASSVVGRLPVRRGVVVLLGVFVGLGIFLSLYDKVMLVGMVGLPEPADSLGRRARDVFLLAELEDRADAIGFDHDQRFLKYAFEPHDNSTWHEWIRKRPVAPIFFWCRQAPKPFAPDLFYPYAGSLEPPRVSWSDPAPIVPGMAAAKVDVHGRLLAFIAIPPEREIIAPAEPPKQLDDEHWRRWFRRSDLDIHHFTRVAPEWVPPMFADTRYAWVAHKEPLSEIPIRVEAATFRGKVVSFALIAPWTRRDVGELTQGVGDQGASVSQLELFVPILVAIFILGPMNLRRGRSDSLGAFRLAVLVFTLQMIVWLCEARHTVESYAAWRLEIRSLVLGLAFALYWAALIAGAYLALEPLVRRWWPEAVISWTRLLAGRWRDPMVGRDFLAGVFGGVVWTVVSMTGNLLPSWLGEPAAIPWWDWWVPNTRVPGFWTGTLLMNLVYSFRTAFFYNLLLLVLLRQVLQRPRYYATAFVLIWTTLRAHDQELLANSPGGWVSISLSLAFLMLGNLIMYGLLVRYGVLAIIVAAFVINSLWFPMTLDVNAGVTHSGLLILLGIVGLASFGFYTASLAGRSSEFRNEGVRK